MNKYESVIIVKNNTSEKQRKAVIERIETFIKESGEIIEIKEIGLRGLAYEIQKCKQAYFFQINFKAKSEVIPELERIYRITDEILKFITIKHD